MPVNPLQDAGAPLRGAALRARLPVLAVATSDIGVVSSTAMDDVPGLVVQLEPYCTYAIDGYIVYAAPAAADAKFSFTVPPGAVGHWFAHGQTAAATGGTGSIEMLQFGIGDQAGAAGFGDIACRPRGYVQTRGLGGPLQWQFAQVTSNVTPTLVQVGSWIRASRMN